MWEKFTRESSQDLIIVSLVRGKYATLHEIETCYNTEDIYDLLEIMQLDGALDQAVEMDSRRQQQIDQMRRGR